jgi:uncharacterized membrane protein
MRSTKDIIREILSRTFSRMTTYLAIFNFCMLCLWLYESDAGAIFKDNGLRAGDVILIALFIIVVVSGIELLILGLSRKEE